MKHLKEFNKFNWLTRAKKHSRGILVVKVSDLETRVLVVADLSKFLRSTGEEVKILRTALEEEDYELAISPKKSIEELFIELPTFDSEGDCEVEVFYKDDPSVQIKFLWTWMKGVHK